MKQLINEFIPDKTAAWKLAAMVLLFLLVVTLIANTVVPLVREIAAAISVNDVDEDLPTKLVQEEGNAAQLNNEIAQNENEIADLKKNLADLQAEYDSLLEQMEENTVKSQQELAQLREEIARNEGEMTDLQTRLEALLVENETLSLELERIRAKFSNDHVIVIKLTRSNMLGVDEPIYFDWHVDAEEYAKHQVGEQMHPVQGLDFPTGKNWSAVIMNMYVNTVEV